MIKTTKAAELLMEYRAYCETRVAALRAEACEWAAKAREITKLIPAEQVQEVEEQKEADSAWSLKGVVDIMKDNK